jgi:hypothetical protein
MCYLLNYASLYSRLSYRIRYIIQNHLLQPKPCNLRSAILGSKKQSTAPCDFASKERNGLMLERT